MRRHGWAFCLGLLVGGPAAVPEPADPVPGTPGGDPGADMPMPAMVGGPPPCTTSTAGPVSAKPTFAAIRDWCTFQSQSRQSGHFITPYRPPLQAWFPCERRCGPCGAWAFPAPVPPVAAVLVPAPVAPAAAAPQVTVPGMGPGPETEVLSGFMKTADGLNFAPGVAPMACPTTQLHRVSHWRPK